MDPILSYHLQQVIHQRIKHYSHGPATTTVHPAMKSSSSNRQLGLFDWETLLLPDLVTKDLISTLESSFLMLLTGLGCGLT